jgi:ATP-binding cassette subfamily F protein 2
MDKMDPSTFATRASLILTGLGFNKVTIHKKTKDMSGGWRMRVALAKALFVKPSLLLLDDPTAHLDLEACVWLEEYLKKWERTLVLISHSQDFLNGVCTTMIDMRKQQLMYYGGNFDSYMKTRKEQEINQMTAYKKQQEEIKHIKEFIASAGTYANLVRQAKSRQKILDKMVADGLIEEVKEDRAFTFRFTDVDKLPPPVLAFDGVTFSYSGDRKDDLYRNIDLGFDMDSRTALVGPNGVGKSTLLRLMTQKISPTAGTVKRHTHLKLGLYSQHSAEQLDLTKSALDFVRDRFSDKSQDYQYWRQNLGKYGVSGPVQTSIMGTLSEGQKSRIVFAILAIESPNMLLLDEPTNGLDIPTIDALADAINHYTGGVIVVSHDFRYAYSSSRLDVKVCTNSSIDCSTGLPSKFSSARTRPLSLGVAPLVNTRTICGRRWWQPALSKSVFDRQSGRIIDRTKAGTDDYTASSNRAAAFVRRFVAGLQNHGHDGTSGSKQGSYRLGMPTIEPHSRGVCCFFNEKKQALRWMRSVVLGFGLRKGAIHTVALASAQTVFFFAVVLLRIGIDSL